MLDGEQTTSRRRRVWVQRATTGRMAVIESFVPAAEPRRPAVFGVAPAAPDATLRALLDAARDGLAVTDANDRIVMANAAFRSLVGVEEATLVGAPMAQWLRLECDPRQVPLPGQPEECDGVVAGKLGEPVAVRVRRSPAPEGGRLWSVIDASASLAIDELREELLSHIVHDLTAPITVTLGFAQILTGPRAGEASQQTRAHAAEAIALQSRRQANLVNDLSDLFRLREGDVPLACERLALADVVDDNCTDIQQLTPGHAIEAHLAPGLPLVWADPRRVLMVLTNLAVMVARRCPARAAVELCAQPIEGGVLYAIGIGAQAALDDRAFVPPHAPAAPGATLWLVQTLVEAHGGRLLPGDSRGTLYFFTLPTAGTSLEPQRAHKKRA
jgi:PAS domain S-box-containing protein